MEDSDSGDYDYCIRPARRQTKFIRTMTELEDEANSILIKVRLIAELDITAAY